MISFVPFNLNPPDRINGEGAAKGQEPDLQFQNPSQGQSYLGMS